MSTDEARDLTGPPVVAMVRDLLFASRITATANALGVAVRVVRDPAKLVLVDGALMLADLNQPDVIEAAAIWKRATGATGVTEGPREVIGFVSHVDRETIDRARAAGIDRVMARSAFVASLEELLRQRPVA